MPTCAQPSSPTHPLSPTGYPITNGSWPYTHSCVSTHSLDSVESLRTSEDRPQSAGVRELVKRLSSGSDESFAPPASTGRPQAPTRQPRVLSMDAFHSGHRAQPSPPFGSSSTDSSLRLGTLASTGRQDTPESDVSREPNTSDIFRSLRELYLKDRLETLESLKNTFSGTDIHVLSRAEEDEREAALRAERNARRRSEDQLRALRLERDRLDGKSRALELHLSSAIDRIERLEDELRHAQGALAATKETSGYSRGGVAPEPSAHAHTSATGFVDPREAAVPCEELPKRSYRRFPRAG